MPRSPRPQRAPRRTLTLLAALALCAVTTGTAHAATDPGATDQAATGKNGSRATCARPAPQSPGTSAPHTLDSGGRSRGYRLHLPADYTEKSDWPVVLAYHGRGNTGAVTEEFSKLSTLPAVVVYPEGVVGTGDGERQAWQGAPYAAPGVDDVAFTDDLLDRVEADLCVDSRRVYATGKSNGAGFVARFLACRSADRITAIAPVAAALYPSGEDCRPSRPVPVIEFHGTGDTTIPYGGDPDRGLPALPDWIAESADRNGCAPAPRVSTVGEDVTVSRYTHCDSGADVAHVAVTGGGHTWPGADSYSGGGYTTQTIEAHQVLWDFLSGFRLPAGPHHHPSHPHHD